MSRRKRVGDRLVDVPAQVFACDFSGDPDPLARACAPEQPDKVEPGQRWMSLETGDTHPVASVRDDIIQRGELLVRLGSASYAILVSDADLRARYVCTDAPDNVVELHGR